MRTLLTQTAAERFRIHLAPWPRGASALLVIPICALLLGLARFYRRFIYTDEG
ncbi:MAG TPA: hypothetical protein VFN67_16080 [Polyangiales bacterium]|jgi:hypothetical protein|nr:hypothetical protein [Polyangiales bacterium]